jgi:hypothetical protein
LPHLHPEGFVFATAGLGGVALGLAMPTETPKGQEPLVEEAVDAIFLSAAFSTGVVGIHWDIALPPCRCLAILTVAPFFGVF